METSGSTRSPKREPTARRLRSVIVLQILLTLAILCFVVGNVVDAPFATLRAVVTRCNCCLPVHWFNWFRSLDSTSPRLGSTPQRVDHTLPQDAKLGGGWAYGIAAAKVVDHLRVIGRNSLLFQHKSFRLELHAQKNLWLEHLRYACLPNTRRKFTVTNYVLFNLLNSMEIRARRNVFL